MLLLLLLLLTAERKGWLQCLCMLSSTWWGRNTASCGWECSVFWRFCRRCRRCCTLSAHCCTSPCMLLWLWLCGRDNNRCFEAVALLLVDVLYLLLVLRAFLW